MSTKTCKIAALWCCPREDWESLLADAGRGIDPQQEASKTWGAVTSYDAYCRRLKDLAGKALDEGAKAIYLVGLPYDQLKRALAARGLPNTEAGRAKLAAEIAKRRKERQLIREFPGLSVQGFVLADASNGIGWGVTWD